MSAKYPLRAGAWTGAVSWMQLHHHSRGIMTLTQKGIAGPRKYSHCSPSSTGGGMRGLQCQLGAADRGTQQEEEEFWV